ncbi:unnamed protein product [Arctogadus glacialis]
MRSFTGPGLKNPFFSPKVPGTLTGPLALALAHLLCETRQLPLGLLLGPSPQVLIALNIFFRLLGVPSKSFTILNNGRRPFQLHHHGPRIGHLFSLLCTC